MNDIAEDFFDLGARQRVDRCCRAHDHCPLKVRRKLKGKLCTVSLIPRTPSLPPPPLRQVKAGEETFGYAGKKPLFTA